MLASFLAAVFFALNATCASQSVRTLGAHRTNLGRLMLLTHCLAAPLPAVSEYLWLTTRLTLAQFAWGTLILGGVAVAITPSKASPPRVRVRPIGFLSVN